VDAENLHAQCRCFMPRWLHHRIPRGLLACATAPSLKPTPTTTWAASLQHQLQVSPVPLYNPSYSLSTPLRRLEKIPRTHIRHSPPAQRYSSPRPQHKQTPPSSNQGAFCDRPTRRAAQPIASKQAIEKSVRSHQRLRRPHARGSVLHSPRRPLYSVPCALTDAFPAPERPHQAALDARLKSPNAPVAGKS
jgi:hypothetical protein